MAAMFMVTPIAAYAGGGHHYGGHHSYGHHHGGHSTGAILGVLGGLIGLSIIDRSINGSRAYGYRDYGYGGSYGGYRQGPTYVPREVCRYDRYGYPYACHVVMVPYY